MPVAINRRPRLVRSGTEQPVPGFQKPAVPAPEPYAAAPVAAVTVTPVPADDGTAAAVVPGAQEPAPAEQAQASATGSAKVTLLPLEDTGPQAIVVPLAQPQAQPPARAAQQPAGSGPAAAHPDPAAAPGATVLSFPTPAFKRRRLRLWTVLGSVAAAVALVVALAVYSPLLALKTITVDGNKLAGLDTILATLAPLQGKPLPQVDESTVEQLLSTLPQVRSVTVEARPPQTLLVHIVERQPVALLKDGDKFIMVDPGGVALGSTADQSAIALPLIDGGTAAIGGKNFVAITAVLAVLPPSVLGKLQHASATSPDAVELKLNDGKTVVWGNASQNELKAKALDALLNTPLPPTAPGKPVRAPVTVYDVSTPRHPVTR
ncbi:cell division protein FtsQ/DivIB [Pseudarthrobacter sp. P1]|uniref:cell division protein FtsQ/DivIB n=1 Tax=Pseudarthrobacter sp. P1 TaxID=3418418 RepID=UPI003CE69AE3